jgi:hypothetical protein
VKIILHDKVPRHDQINIQGDPMRVFLTSKIELVINRGDRLIDVVEAVRPHMPHFSRIQIKAIVAYYFAMGERAVRGNFTEPWQPEEYRVKRNRKYLKGVVVERSKRKKERV